MTAYSDTSFLCALYRDQDNTEKAQKHRATIKGPVLVTELLEFEFLQSIRLQVWLHVHDRRKGNGLEEADAMIANWEQDLATGILQIVAADSSAVIRQATSLSRRFTIKGGHRSLDVLHVATALSFAATDFLTFDDRQKKLARAAGLKTPL